MGVPLHPRVTFVAWLEESVPAQGTLNEVETDSSCRAKRGPFGPASFVVRHHHLDLAIHLPCEINITRCTQSHQQACAWDIPSHAPVSLLGSTVPRRWDQEQRKKTTRAKRL